MVLHWIPDSVQYVNRRSVWSDATGKGAKQALTETLLPQSDSLQLFEAVLFSRAVDDSIFEDLSINTVVINSRLDRCSTLLRGSLDLPAVAALVVKKAGVVIALVEVFQHRRENLGFLVRKGDAAGCIVHVVTTEGILEERRGAEDIFMGSKKTLLGTDDEGDDG